MPKLRFDSRSRLRGRARQGSWRAKRRWADGELVLEHEFSRRVARHQANFVGSPWPRRSRLLFNSPGRRGLSNFQPPQPWLGGGGACSVLASKVLLPCVAAEQCAFAWMWTVEGARGVPSARPHQHTCGRAAAGSARPQGGESATTDPPTHPSRSDAGGEVPAIHAPPRGLYNSEGSASALSHLNRLERKSKQVMDANNHAGGCRTPMCVASWTGIAVFAAALLAAAAAGGQRLAPAPAPTAGRASAGARPAITCRWST